MDRVYAPRKPRTLVSRLLRGTSNVLLHVVQSLLYLLLALVMIVAVGGLVVAGIDLLGRGNGAESVWPEFQALAAGVPGGLLIASLAGLAVAALLVRLNDWLGEHLRLSTFR